MSVHKNCYLFQSGNDVIIEINNNKTKRFNRNDLGYSHSEEGIEFAKDQEGNYYYTADDCKQIQ